MRLWIVSAILDYTDHNTCILERSTMECFLCLKMNMTALFCSAYRATSSIWQVHATDRHRTMKTHTTCMPKKAVTNVFFFSFNCLVGSRTSTMAMILNLRRTWLKRVWIVPIQTTWRFRDLRCLGQGRQESNVETDSVAKTRERGGRSRIDNLLSCHDLRSQRSKLPFLFTACVIFTKKSGVSTQCPRRLDSPSSTGCRNRFSINPRATRHVEYLQIVRTIDNRPQSRSQADMRRIYHRIVKKHIRRTWKTNRKTKRRRKKPQRHEQHATDTSSNRSKQLRRKQQNAQTTRTTRNRTTTRQ